MPSPVISPHSCMLCRCCTISTCLAIGLDNAYPNLHINKITVGLLTHYHEHCEAIGLANYSTAPISTQIYTHFSPSPPHYVTPYSDGGGGGCRCKNSSSDFLVGIPTSVCMSYVGVVHALCSKNYSLYYAILMPTEVVVGQSLY